MSRLERTVVATLIIALASWVVPVAAEAPITVEELLDNPSVDLDRGKLLKGKIEWFGAGSHEATKEEIVAVMAVWLPVSLPAAAEILHSAPDAVLQSSEITGTTLDEALASFATLTGDRDVEIKKLLSSDVAKDFNLSAEEIGRFKALARRFEAENTNMAVRKQKTVSAVRELLAQRYLEYRLGGLKAISAYQRDDETIYPGKHLSASMKPMTMLKSRLPELYNVFLKYPRGAESFDQRFMWTKEMSDDRPMVILKHWMVTSQPEFMLVAERRFYISHTLDAMHVFIIILPYEGGSLVAMVNQSFTGMVSGMGSSIAHRVGRGQVAKQIRPLFEYMQKKGAAKGK